MEKKSSEVDISARKTPEAEQATNAWLRYVQMRNQELADMMATCHPMSVRNSSKGPHRHVQAAENIAK